MRNLLFTFRLIASVFLVGVSASAGLAQQSHDLPEDELKAYKKEITELVSFYEFCLNLLGDEAATKKEKNTIINESYLKIFRDENVQVEDDLEEKRDVVTNKDVQAYLKDIEFFFENVIFQIDIGEIKPIYSETGRLQFKVIAVSNLAGTKVNKDSVNYSQTRFIEIEANRQKQELKIVSIYSTKLYENELRAWWNNLSCPWIEVLLKAGNMPDTVGVTDTIDYDDLVRIKNLETLDISWNKNIQYFEELEDLPELRSLNLSGTNIQNLESIRKLRKLRSLLLAQTKITNIQAIENLKYIETLDISHTKVFDIIPLTGLHKIRSLNLANTNIDSLDAITTLTNLEYLNCSQTRIKDIFPLKNLKRIKELDCSKTRINSLAPLNQANALKILNCERTRVNSLRFLEGLPSLKKVYCDFTEIPPDHGDAFMEKMPNTLVIYRSSMLVKWWNELPGEWNRFFSKIFKLKKNPSRETLATMVQTTELDISSYKEITSLQPLSVFENLEELNTSGLPIKSLNVVSAHKNLQYLDCSSTLISNLEPISHLRKLISLKISGTGIDSLSYLSNLRNLEFLDCSKTGVADLEALLDLEKIKLLYADQTQIGTSVVDTFNIYVPGCLVIYQSEKLRTWWKDLPKAWRKVFRQHVRSAVFPNSEQLHSMYYIKKLKINDDRNIFSLKPVQDFTRLKDLEFINTNIIDLSPIQNITSIENLQCSNSPLTTLDSLSQLINLRKLNCSNTGIKTVEVVKNMNKMEQLNLAGTKVISLKPVSKLRQLNSIDCSNTKVKSLKPLFQLTRLKMLKCYNTRISSGQIRKFKELNPNCEVVYY